ncbi:hypothetical protein [Neiella marina]|uniref:hypothetical protein n=1 Tax=Neiella marina TaxID=508461 RepID=UPI000B3D0270|nr:hypothetical protein [Neiella marina]
MSDRVGTEFNRWQLVPEDCDRPLLPDHTDFDKLNRHPNMDGTQLPKRILSIQQNHEQDCYVKNVLTNSNLSNVELLLAILLYREIQFEFSGAVFTICRSGVDYSSKIESCYEHTEEYCGGLMVEHPKDCTDYDSDVFFFAEVENLLTLFNEESAMSIEPKTLRSALINLHQVGYVTVSQMSAENKVTSNIISQGTRKGPRPSLLHVRLCSWMRNRNISKSWNKVLVRKRTKKFVFALRQLTSDIPEVDQEELEALCLQQFGTQ